MTMDAAILVGRKRERGDRIEEKDKDGLCMSKKKKRENGHNLPVF